MSIALRRLAASKPAPGRDGRRLPSTALGGHRAAPVTVTGADGTPARLGDSDPFHAYASGALAATAAALSAAAWALGPSLLLVLGALGATSGRRRRTA